MKIKDSLLPLILCVLLWSVYDFVFENYPEYTRSTMIIEIIIYAVAMIISCDIINIRNSK